MSTRNKVHKTGMRARPGMVAGEKAKNFKGTIRKLIRYMRPYTLRIIFIVIFCRQNQADTLPQDAIDALPLGPVSAPALDFFRLFHPAQQR